MKETEEKLSLGQIVGNGDIAQALSEIQLKDFTYFASGVSNSQEGREPEYIREINLLLQQDHYSHLVYFGSLSVFYSDTRYTKHKLTMEGLIKANFPFYTIVRLGNITWGNNHNTLINFLKNNLAAGVPLEIRDTTRYVIDKNEFHHWIKLIPEWSCEMNITGQPMKVSEIVKKYVL